MIIKTRAFELYNGKFKNLSELAQAMGISVSQVYRVREGKRSINQKFIIGAVKAFPEYRFNDLFYLAPDPKFGDVFGANIDVDYHYRNLAFHSMPAGKLQKTKAG